MTPPQAPVAPPATSGLNATLATLACAVLYFLAFKLQGLLGSWLTFERGVDWVFLPSGLRLCLVLLMPLPGAIGVSLASIWLGWPEGVSWLEPTVTGLISGFAPLLARGVAIRWLGLDPNLQALSGQSLLALVTVFALLCSSLHQAWYAWIGRSDHPLASMAVMFIGDMFGALICLYALLGALKLWTRHQGAAA